MVQEYFDEYYQEASEMKTWGAAPEVAATKQPRVLLEVGGNTLRRSRGGKTAVFENLWPKLSMVVCMDYRMSETALHADIVLPATTMFEIESYMTYGPIFRLREKVIEPVAEARNDYLIMAELAAGRVAPAERHHQGFVPFGGVKGGKTAHARTSFNEPASRRISAALCTSVTQ